MLIGIHGFKGAGKDTLCNMIAELYPETVRLAFADKGKEYMSIVLGVPVEFIDEVKNNDNIRIVIEDASRPHKHISDFNMRTAMRRFMHDGRGIFGEDIWANLCVGNRERSFHWHHIVCVTDVRYNNEAEIIRDKGGFIVQIVRPFVESDGHESETGISTDLIDYTINNDKGLEELRMATRVLLHDLQSGPRMKNDLHLPMMEAAGESRMH